MNIHFAKQKKLSQRADHSASVGKADREPCLMLVHNDNWNDYGYFTWFVMWYLDDGQKSVVGNVKIMHMDDDVYEKLPETFESLDESFCSVGMNLSYYTDMLGLFGKDTTFEILHALRDCIVTPQIQERFNTTDAFNNSLKRDMSTKRVFEEALLILEDKDTENAYSFSYLFTPKYNEAVNTEWNLHLEYDAIPFKRTSSIIGVNGVGKTQLLSNMVDDLVHRNTSRISQIPLLQSVLVICSSHFDAYNDIDNTSSAIPLTVCSVVQEKETEKNLADAINVIMGRESFFYEGEMMFVHEHYVQLLREQLGDEIAGGLISRIVGGDKKTYYRFNEEHLKHLVKTMSTGELQTFSLITYVCENIHLSSLIVIDEPEVHLHPHLVTSFFITLNMLLRRFNSYAIIPTHSPLVVRECISHNVYLMQRNSENIPMIAEVPFNTFGEDISTLYENIFDYQEKRSYFFSVVNKLVAEGNGFDRIVKILESHQVKLNRNSLFIIRDCLTAYKNGN